MDKSSAYIISLTLPTGEYIHLPLPQKHTEKSRSSSTLIKNRIDPSSYKDSMKTTLLAAVDDDDDEKKSINRLNFLSSTHLY